MARVVVRFYATLRSVSGSESVVMDASSLPEVDRLLRVTFGDEMGRLLGSPGAPLEGVVVLLNGVNVARERFADVSLTDGDEVAVFPPVSGG